MIRKLLEEYENGGLIIDLEKNILIGLWSRIQRFNIGRWKGCIRGREEFEYLRIKVDNEDRQENYIKNRINKGRVIRQC